VHKYQPGDLTPNARLKSLASSCAPAGLVKLHQLGSVRQRACGLTATRRAGAHHATASGLFRR
jgi:hypothetical protein